MKNSYRILLQLLTAAFMLSSCNDIFEKDISNNTINIQSPPDNYVSQNYQVVFIWGESKGIQKYRLQIATPSFDSVQRVVVDTVTTSLNLTLTLFPGRYQWRLRGENNSSNTNYQTRTLIVDTTTNLNNQVFNVNTPADNYYTRNNIISFSWLAFPYATSYEYNLMDSLNNIIKIKSVFSTYMSDTLQEGSYKWKARALNTGNGTATQFSIMRTLVVDMTAPLVSAPSLPVNKDSVINNVKLMWTQQTGTYTDSVFISTDSTFQNIIYRNSTQSANSLNLSALTTGNIYYWRLRSADKAGNLSGYSSFFSFYIKP